MKAIDLKHPDGNWRILGYVMGLAWEIDGHSNASTPREYISNAVMVILE